MVAHCRQFAQTLDTVRHLTLSDPFCHLWHQIIRMWFECGPEVVVGWSVCLGLCRLAAALPQCCAHIFNSDSWFHCMLCYCWILEEGHDDHKVCYQNACLQSAACWIGKTSVTVCYHNNAPKCWDDHRPVITRLAMEATETRISAVVIACLFNVSL